LKTIYRN
jgi:hypothetical protein